MKHEDIITELEQLAEQMGVVIRYEKGDFDGGYCILKEARILVVNKKLAPPKKASVLALGMNAIGLENVYLKPAIREFIDDETARMRLKSGVPG